MESIVTFIIIIIVIVLAVGFVQGGKINKFRAGLATQYPEAKIYISNNDNSYIVVDFVQNQLVIGLQKARGSPLAREQPYEIRIPFTDIVKVEALHDGTQIASTNRGSQALGVAVGAIALGGIGAVIGGLSASSTTSSGTKRLSLQITINDPNKPIHEITFYKTERKNGGKRGEVFFDLGAKEIAEFGAHLDTAVRISEKVKTVQNPTAEHVSEKATTNQLRELWQLKEVGALSQEEFDEQKFRLLAR